MEGALVLLRTKRLRDVGAFIVAHIYEVPLLLFDHDGSVVRRLVAPEFTDFVAKTADPLRAHRRTVLALVQARPEDLAFLPVARFLLDQTHPDRIREDLESLFVEQVLDLVGAPVGSPTIPEDWNPAIFDFDELRVHGYGRSVPTPGIQEQLNSVNSFMELCNVLGKNGVTAPDGTSNIKFIRSFFLRTRQGSDLGVRWWSYVFGTTAQEVYDYAVTDEIVQSTFGLLYTRIKDTYGLKGLEAYLIRDPVFRDTYNFNILSRDLVTNVTNPLISTYVPPITLVTDPLTQLSVVKVLQDAFAALHNNELLRINSPFDSGAIIRSALGIPEAVATAVIQDVAGTWMFCVFVILVTILAGAFLVTRTHKQKIREVVAVASTWITVAYAPIPAVQSQAMVVARYVQAGLDVAMEWSGTIARRSTAVVQTAQARRIAVSRRLAGLPPLQIEARPDQEAVVASAAVTRLAQAIWATPAILSRFTELARERTRIPRLLSIEAAPDQVPPQANPPAAPPIDSVVVQMTLVAPQPDPAVIPRLPPRPPPAPAPPPPPVPPLPQRFVRLGPAVASVVGRAIPINRGDPNPFHLTDSYAPLIDLLYGRLANVNYTPVADYQQRCLDYLATLPRATIADLDRLTGPEVWPGLSDAAIERGILAFWRTTLTRFSKTPPKKMKGPDFWLIRCIT